jgi:RNA polymerase sigma-70 factor (ECF subfamily)
MPQRHAHMTDQELLEQFRRTGEQSWLGCLLERYTLLLFGVCMKYLKDEEEAKDAVQQVFLKALTELGKYRVEYVKSWLYTIARNLCLMQLRDRGKPTVEISERLRLEDIGEDPKLIQRVQQQDLESLEEGLQHLSAEQRTCVVMFYLEKRTYQQVSEKTGFTYNEVKSHIQNGKRNLRIFLQKRTGSHE